MKNHLLHLVSASIIFAVLSCGSSTQKETSAIVLEPVGDPVVVEKVPVTDSRVVRGFRGTPVDGTLKSFDFRGYFTEYPDSLSEGFDASSGIDYFWNDNDGLHIAFGDADGFDALILRGGASARMYDGFDNLTEPEGVRPLAVFGGSGKVEVKRFGKRIATDGVSFHGVGDGDIADLAFFRIGKEGVDGRAETWLPADSPADLPEPDRKFAPESVKRSLEALFGDADRTAIALAKGATERASLSFTAERAVHFITPSLDGGAGLDAVGLDIDVADTDGPFACTAVLHDPADPALDLCWFRFTGNRSGMYRIILDVPDQVLAAGDRLWVTLIFDRALTVNGPEIGMYLVPADTARPEALAHRKFLLKTFFALLSECRPWGSYRRQPRDEFFSINRYTALLPQLFMTIDRCHDLAPEDDEVRQYREWVFLNHLETLSDVQPPPDPPSGVPAWAWYPRMAWLEARGIVEWWLENRLVPTGEFGGKVSDDSDLYQQFADLPFLESGGVGKRILDGAARLAEVADQEHLEDGLNLLTCDTLHAYEEGINHMAVMARWFYGDPVYLERCMVSARNMEKLTYVTKDGRRHFRDRRAMGHIDMTDPHEPSIDGHATPLMWHTALQTIDYNRNPLALKTVREWADSWLRFMKPGRWATEVEVMTGKVLASSPNRPLYGGYRTQACVFTWLAGLTGEEKYVEPFLHYYRRGEAPAPANGFLDDTYSLGLLKSLPAATITKLSSANPLLDVFVNGDPSSLIEEAIGNPRPGSAVIKTLYDMRRWPVMYTSAEQFTDRLFTNILETGALSHLGGYCQRNNFNPTLAVSWEGFGTGYGALVTDNRRDGFSVLVYSYADTPVTGTMRVWNIEHGTYRITIGTDADGDMKADTADRSDTVELMKADGIPLTLPPKTVTVVRVEQVEKLDPIFARADLALAARETKVENTTISGVAHNIGSARAGDVVAAVLDESGAEIVRRSLGALDAPVDLVPRRVEFSLELPAAAQDGWTLVLDPDGDVPEIYEGNNTVTLGEMWPPDYSKGWE